MLIYFLRRVALAVSVLFAALATAFIIFFVGPSDPAGSICAQAHQGRDCRPEQVQQYAKSMGLDKPKPEQFLNYLKGLFVGTEYRSGGAEGFVKKCDAPCMGWSFKQDRSVTKMVIEAFPVTVSIVVGGVIVYMILGLLAGVVAAKYRGRPLDRVIVIISQVVPAIPYYIAALVFYLYAMRMNAILPLSKWTPITENPVAWFTGLISVWLFYGTYQSTYWVRWVRSFMIDVQNSDYVRTARSKGLSERAITVKHALRAAIPPVITMLGLSIALELGGAIFTETIFDLPGMGRLAIDAFNGEDLPVIMGVVIMTAFFVSMGNLIVDMIQGLLDPRVKLS